MKPQKIRLLDVLTAQQTCVIANSTRVEGQDQITTFPVINSLLWGKDWKALRQAFRFHVI